MSKKILLLFLTIAVAPNLYSQSINKKYRNHRVIGFAIKNSRFTDSLYHLPAENVAFKELPGTMFSTINNSLHFKNYIPLPWSLTGFPISAESIYITIESIDLWEQNLSRAYKGVTIPF